MEKCILTVFTRSPLHLGAGTSVGSVDLPIMRERITNFPVIPSTSLKGVLRQHARDQQLAAEQEKALFGEDDSGASAHAGSAIVGEGRIIAFPVRSLKGCFAWITSPLALQRLQRDTFRFDYPTPEPDFCVASESVTSSGIVVLEEYPLEVQNDVSKLQPVVASLARMCPDPVWAAHLAERLVIVHDENFQHLVTSTTEIVARICIDPSTRTNENLFNQENVPSETLFYSVCYILPQSRRAIGVSPKEIFEGLFGEQNRVILQIGAGETVGLGFSEISLLNLNGGKS